MSYYRNKDRFSDDLREFIVHSGIVCDVDKLVNYFGKLGAHSFEDLKYLSLEDLKEEETGNQIG